MQEQLKLFQKIEIVESAKQTKPGSIGYIMSLNEVGPYNVLDVTAVFTRFGKSGKDRFSVCRVRIPLIDINCLSILKGSKEDFEKLINSHLMPKNITTRSAFNSIIKVIPEESKNLIELDTWNFMAYISAISMFISSHGIGNRINNDVGMNEITASNIGNSIYRISRIKNLYPRLKEYVEYFDNNQNRKEWLDKLRKEMSVYKQAITTHLNNVSTRYKLNYNFLREAATKNGLKLKKLDMLN